MSSSIHTLLQPYPHKLIEALLELEKESEETLYLVGGTVRDWLLGRVPKDLDFALRCGAIHGCKRLQKLLGGGSLVLLGRQEDEAGRLVWQGLTIDIAAFRKGATTIEEDLMSRDFTLNGMAIVFKDLVWNDDKLEVIDPLHGRKDLAQNRLRACAHSFTDDPLRMLRGYRLSASFGFVMEEQTRQEIIRHGDKIQYTSVERISYELDCIMATEAAHDTIKNMARTGLLFHIFPDLHKGIGLVQPSSHHLDVFHHCLETLRTLEQILKRPEDFFTDYGNHFFSYLEKEGVVKRLKWAALFHDLGKPFVYEQKEGGRITFYNHDNVGRMQFEVIAKNMRWSSEDTGKVGRLIGLHMHPFHLCNVQRKEKISKRACLKLCKKAGEDLQGLMILSMADSLACKGEKAPPTMEKELGELFCTLQETVDYIIQPVLSGPRLIDGRDLINNFNLQPGPIFSTIFRALELARVEGMVQDRREAMEWVAQYIQEHSDQL